MEIETIKADYDEQQLEFKVRLTRIQTGTSSVIYVYQNILHFITRGRFAEKVVYLEDLENQSARIAQHSYHAKKTRKGY